jgi:PhoPQ-activated pathogenicity-related protein
MGLAFALIFTASGLQAEEKGALDRYIERPEPDYGWEIVHETQVEGVTVYDLLLTSQKWKDIVWRHHLSVVVPDQLRDTGACLLFITGGGVRDGQPKIQSLAEDKELQSIGKIANLTGSPVAVLRQVPNQPLYGGKVEDELIAHTYDQFLKDGQDDWPLLLPMTKSAVKAMDAIGELGKEKGFKAEKFVTSGGSKRGWTTWLTGAADKRVVAIAPIVIDTLNFGKQMPYQLEVWGKYSEQIEDYTRLGIQEKMGTPEGQILNSIVDPYSYLDRLTMPKLIFIGTNDPYWPVDAVRHYYGDLKGEKHIHYVPNAGHGLGDGKQAVETLAAYFAYMAEGKPFPELTWSTSQSERRIALEMYTEASQAGVKLWTATSSTRDFRNAQWSMVDGCEAGKENCTVGIELPADGFKAFYGQVLFPHPGGGTFSECTQVYVASPAGIVQ